MHGFHSNFSCGLPWAIRPVVFLIFEKKIYFYEHISFSLTWDPMGAKISKGCSSYKSQPQVFKLFLNFLPNGPHKTTFMIFEILKIEILTNVFRFRWHGTQWERKFQNATPIKSQPNVLKLALNFPRNGSHKTAFGVFDILSFWFLMIFFFESSKVTIVTYGEIKNLNYLENELS